MASGFDWSSELLVKETREAEDEEEKAPEAGGSDKEDDDEDEDDKDKDKDDDKEDKDDDKDKEEDDAEEDDEEEDDVDDVVPRPVLLGGGTISKCSVTDTPAFSRDRFDPTAGGNPSPTRRVSGSRST